MQDGEREALNPRFLRFLSTLFLVGLGGLTLSETLGFARTTRDWVVALLVVGILGAGIWRWRIEP